MSENNELEPCPYCGGHASLSKVARDWYRIAADHVTGCPVEYFQLDCPQSDDQLPLLLRDWNTRIDRRPSSCAERDKIKDEIEKLRLDKSEPCDSCFMADAEALRKESERLQKAIAFVQRLCDSAGSQPSVATGYLHDILSVMRTGDQP